MLKYLKAVIVLSLLMPNSLAYAQYQVSEVLWKLSDEIVLVKVIDEKTEMWQSLTSCTSQVTIEVVKTFKSTTFTPDLKQLIFSRKYNCSNGNVDNDLLKLKRDRLYIVFLSSKNPGWVKNNDEAPVRVYNLSDHGLGVQESNYQLEGFLQSKQREKH